MNADNFDLTEKVKLAIKIFIKSTPCAPTKGSC